MKVKDLLAVGGETMYMVVDASLPGFLSYPHYLHNGGDRNVIGKEFGDLDVVSFDVTKKNTMILYVK